MGEPMRRREWIIINTARVIVFIGLLSVLPSGATEQISAAAAGLASLFIPSFMRWIYPKPSRRMWPWVSPFYNDGVYALFAVFMTAHITFLNVPFIHLDLYNQVWGYADIPSHFLGGLITWVIFNEVVLEASRTYKRNWSQKKIIGISFLALAFVGIGWEFMEVFLQPSIPWLYETLLNKIRDVTMELLGFCTGILMVYKFEYPYSPTRLLENNPADLYALSPQRESEDKASESQIS